MTKKKRRLEAIRWMDHCSYSESGWKSAEDLQNLSPTSITYIGYVAQETKGHVTLVSTIDDQGHLGRGEQCIIKSAIVKRWRLKDPA